MSDDDDDGKTRFGWRAQQRTKERERRERAKEDRRKRERDAVEERELEAEVTRRIAEGDLRERVAARVVELLKSDENQQRIESAVATTRAAKRQVRHACGQPLYTWLVPAPRDRCLLLHALTAALRGHCTTTALNAVVLVLTQALLAAVHEEGDEAVREARRKEEERLSENRRVADILAENERLVAAEAKRRDEEERCLPSMPRPAARSPIALCMVPTHAAPTRAGTGEIDSSSGGLGRYSRRPGRYSPLVHRLQTPGLRERTNVLLRSPSYH